MLLSFCSLFYLGMLLLVIDPHSYMEWKKSGDI